MSFTSGKPYLFPLAESQSLNPAGRLRARAWGAVALVSILLIAHQLLLQPLLIQLSLDAPVINVAGRQRMLSQKLAKTALAWETATTTEGRTERQTELAAILEEWTQAHRGLQFGDADLQLSGTNNEQTRSAFNRLAPHFEAISHAVQELSDSSHAIGMEITPSQREALKRILYHEPEFLNQMHELVGLYAAEARNRVRSLQALGWGIVAAILALLLLAQWFIIRPAVDLLGSRFASSEDQYRRLVELMSEGLLVQDRTGKILFANPRMCELLGTSLSEIQGQLASIFIADADRARYEHMITNAAVQVEPLELAIRASNGILAETVASIRPLIDNSGVTQGILLVMTDITARRQAEQRSRELLEQLVHADRLKSMGEMTAGLAHEINQPLAAITNFAEAGLASLRQENTTLETLQIPFQRILSAALRGGEIIRRTRRFAQRQPHEVRPESLNDLAKDVEQLCRPEALRRNVKLELSLGENLPLVPVDGVQIQQVLTNLIQNAFAAMESTPAYRRRLKIATEHNPSGILVSISDCGHGVQNQDTSQLFKPFVTTREDGLGLGLAIAKNIVESHGGTIEVVTNPDAGATFRFTLPVNPIITCAAPNPKQEEPLHV